jgi:hypothetical protein
MEGVMGRPRKLPPNVVRFRPDEIRALKRATPFTEKPRYFYRDTPPLRDWLIFEYCYYSDMKNLFYAGGNYSREGKMRFHCDHLNACLDAGDIKVLSWRLESEWHGSARKLK